MAESTLLFINTDGGSRGNPGPAAIGVAVTTPAGDVVHTISQYLGVGTNNEAEYQAILSSLEWLRDYTTTNTVAKVVWRLDSKLVVEQLSKRWKIKEARLLDYAQRCWVIMAALTPQLELTYVPREQNKAADALVNQALDQAATK